MSKGFVFRLEAVLQQRIREEEAVQVEVARALRGRSDAIAHLASMRTALADLDRELSSIGVAVDLEARMSTLYYRDRAVQIIGQQEGVIARWDGEVARTRAILLQASHRRRVLEKLRERREHEFKAETERRANEALNELITLRYGNPAGEVLDVA